MAGIQATHFVSKGVGACVHEGAHNMGLDSLFVAGGIHAAELGVSPEAAGAAERDTLDALLYKHNTRPTMMMSYLRP